MTGIIPNVSAGGLPTTSPLVTNAAIPPAPFSLNCTNLGLPNDCTGRILPSQINAVVSEMLNLAACMSPNGVWACSSLSNLCTAFNAYVNGTGPDTLQGDTRLALGFKNCAGVLHAAGASLPSCTEMTTAIAAIGTSDPQASPYFLGGAGAVTRTINNKLQERITFRDLGCIGNGVADDGATLNAAIYARYSGLSLTQNQLRVEIHGVSGDTYKFATQVNVRQANMHFIGNGAKIVCAGAQRAFNFTQDSGPNQNLHSLVSDFDITGATDAAIYAYGAPFFQVLRNRLEGNNDGVVTVACVEPRIAYNYIRGNSGSGIKIWATALNQSCYRAIVERNIIYLNGAVQVWLRDAYATEIIGNDFEVVGGVTEVLVQNSINTIFMMNYAEPAQIASNLVVQIENTGGFVASSSSGGQYVHNSFGGGTTISFKLNSGNSNIIGLNTNQSSVNLVTGNGNKLLPNNNATVVTDTASGTIDWTDMANLKGVTTVSPGKIAAKNPKGSFDVTGAVTTGAVVFGPAETDQSYMILFGVWDITNNAPVGACSCRMTVRGTTGYSWKLDAAPGAATVRVHWEMRRLA